MVDQVENQPPSAGAPEFGQVDAPKGEVRFNRLAPPAYEGGEALTSGSVSP